MASLSAHLSSAPEPFTGRGLLAEAVTFDPGLVVALFLVFALVCIAGVAVVVVGICAGYVSGRDAGRTRAMTAWQVCLALEGVALVLALGAVHPVSVLVTGAAFATAIAAHRIGRSSGSTRP